MSRAIANIDRLLAAYDGEARTPSPPPPNARRRKGHNALLLGAIVFWARRFPHLRMRLNMAPRIDCYAPSPERDELARAWAKVRRPFGALRQWQEVQRRILRLEAMD